LRSTKDSTLKTIDKQVIDKREEIIYLESDVELKNRSFLTPDKPSTIPENQSDNPKQLTLRESEEKVRPNSSPVQILKSVFETFTVQSKAVLSSQRSDSTDGTNQLLHKPIVQIPHGPSC